MLQKNQETQVKEEGKLSAEVLSKLEEVQNQPTTKTVKLRIDSCCGCGCHEVDIKRVVPFDSPLEDGDKVYSWEDDDEIL